MLKSGYPGLGLFNVFVEQRHGMLARTHTYAYDAAMQFDTLKWHSYAEVARSIIIPEAVMCDMCSYGKLVVRVSSFYLSPLWRLEGYVETINCSSKQRVGVAVFLSGDSGDRFVIVRDGARFGNHPDNRHRSRRATSPG